MKRVALALILVGSAFSPHQDRNGLSGPVLYVANDDGVLRAYQEGTWKLLGTWLVPPLTAGIRGTAFDGSSLFFAVGGGSSHGKVVKWDLVNNAVVFTKSLSSGADQLNTCNGTLYMPAGQGTSSHTWYKLSESDGSVQGTMSGGLGPHNTLCASGHWYLGGRKDNYLYQSSGPKIGPSPSNATGVRPFTVGRSNSRAWITWTSFRGFSVGDTSTGKILATVKFGSNPSRPPVPALSHGISVDSGDNTVYVIDLPQDAVRAYTTTDSPSLKATISLSHHMYGGHELPCVAECKKDGWLQHSVDNRYVFVGDSGDIIDTSTNRVTAYIGPLANTRHGFIDVLWQNGKPVRGNHFGYGN